MEKRIAELTVYLRGWINYFGIGQGYQKCIDLDHWIRRRLRMFTGLNCPEQFSSSAKLVAGWPTRSGPLICGAGLAQKSEICSNSVCRLIWLLPAVYRAKVIGEVQKLREFIEHYPMNSLRKKACYRCEIGGWRFIAVKEPPCAEPHARWCGEGELDASLYPIRF